MADRVGAGEHMYAYMGARGAPGKAIPPERFGLAHGG